MGATARTRSIAGELERQPMMHGEFSCVTSELEYGENSYDVRVSENDDYLGIRVSGESLEDPRIAIYRTGDPYGDLPRSIGELERLLEEAFPEEFSASVGL